MEKSMKKMLRQTFRMLEPEQCLEMRNYQYSFNRNFIIYWQMELCGFFYYFFYCVLVHPEFWLYD